MVALLKMVSKDSIRSLPTGLPILESGWPLRPFQIVSLYEMLFDFPAGEILNLVGRTPNIRLGICEGIQQFGTGEILDQKHRALANEIRLQLDALKPIISPFGFKRTLERIEYLEIVSATRDTGITLHILLERYDQVWNALTRDCLEKQFLWMPKQYLPYFNIGDLFGSEVAQAFPEANKEISLAGSCFGFGCYTACVFHLMRAVEIGARGMIRELNASKYLVNRSGNRVPIELCDWHTLVTAIQKGVNDLAAKTSTSNFRKKRFEHYNHASAVFLNFKDAWRNHVSHTRELYQHGKAKDVMENTRQFFVHLANKPKRQSSG